MSVKTRSHYSFSFLRQLLLKFKNVNDASQHFNELKQNQKNSSIQKNGLCEPTVNTVLVRVMHKQK